MRIRFSLLAFLFCVASSVPAQQVTGTIAGSVVDPSAGAIAGATVNLTSQATGAVRSIQADNQGDFVFTAVTPGIYTVTAEHAGFKKYLKQNIEVAPGATLALGALRLELGSTSESITITAEGTAIQTASSERAGSISSAEMKDLTVINRDFTMFAELQPGVVVNQSAEVQSFTGANSINALGGRTTGNNILIDGVPATNTNQGNQNTTISLDAVQTIEVKVANFSAEYGRNQGVTIMAVSKGGSQQLHGSAYYYDRNEGFNANTFFNNQRNLPRNKYRISNFGGTLGGPLHIPGSANSRNQLFFFVSEEEIREVRIKAEQDLTVPTALERAGDFSQSVGSNGKPITISDPLNLSSSGKATPFPNNQIPANRVLASTQNYLKLLPLPNFLNTAVSNYQYNFVYQENMPVPKRIDTGRLDYNPSPNTLMYLRFNFWWEQQKGAGASGGNSAWGWLPTYYTATTPSGVYSLTRILNPATVLQASMGFQRFTEAGPAASDADVQAKTRTAAGVNIPQFNSSINPLNLVPAASFGGVSNSPSPSYATRFPLRGAENTFNWNGTLNKNAGGHSFKVGIYAERWRAMKGEQATFAGKLDFTVDTNNPLDTGNPYSNALIGTLKSYTESSSRPPMYEYTSNIEWFAQDSWRVSRHLTLDLGVRWGWGQPWHSVQNLEAGFVPGLWSASQAVQLMKPVMSNGKRMAQDPITGAIYPAVDIGAIASEAGNPFNGAIYRIKDPSYPAGLRSTDGIKTAPRLGFAWDPTGSGKTVIRGGAGLFYDTHERDNYQSGVQYDAPIQTNPIIYYTTVQSFITGSSLLFPTNTNGLDPNRHIQMTMNFSFNVQRDIGHGTVVDVAYVGALGRHLSEREDLNATPLGTNWQPQNFDSTNGNKALPSSFLVRYPGYGNIYYYFNGGNSSYHSLQTTVRRRYKGNLTYGVVWTWSKAMDYSDDDASGSGETVTTQMSQKVWNYGLAGFDHTHIFRFYYNYNLPHAGGASFTKAVLDGWHISGITTFQSGAPTAVSGSFVSSSSGGPASGDVTGSTDSAWRTLIVANPILPKDQRNAGGNLLALNTAAFGGVPWQACQVADAPFVCWGNSSRYPFRGPGINNWDISLFKNFGMFREKLKGEFRVEGYNPFNHTNFSGVNTSAQFDKAGVQTNRSFGQYNASQFQRRLQLALRLSF
jgi:hypothetical protein